jgi:hypothetical protein
MTLYLIGQTVAGVHPATNTEIEPVFSDSPTAMTIIKLDRISQQRLLSPPVDVMPAIVQESLARRKVMLRTARASLKTPRNAQCRQHNLVSYPMSSTNLFSHVRFSRHSCSR